MVEHLYIHRLKWAKKTLNIMTAIELYVMLVVGSYGGGWYQTWVKVHFRVLKYFTSTLVAMLSTSTSTITENDNVLKYCVKYFKQYLSTSKVPILTRHLRCVVSPPIKITNCTRKL